MTQDKDRSPHEDGTDLAHQADSSLEDLRQILFGQQATKFEGELQDLGQRLTDRDTLAAIIAPVLGDAIRRQIRDARDEMIEALYPLIGQLVVRAVSEAIRDLARNIDAQMRTSLSLRAIWQRFWARVRGVSGTQMAFRASLPFEVTEVFLIHRETGLLLQHVSHDPDASTHSDLISGMLTAIRDFAQDAFGRGQEGQLDEIQYGERRILIEAARYAYLAVVLNGIEPSGFRAEMRERIIQIDHAYQETLRHYDGDATPLAGTESSLRSLVQLSEPRALSSTQKRVLAGAAGLVALCLVGACLAGVWTWQTIWVTPTPVPVAVEPTPTFTATPSPTTTATPSPTTTSTNTPTPSATLTPTPSPTHTPTSTATSTPSVTPTPSPTPVVGLMTGSAWLREGPSADSPRLGVVMQLGQTVEILAAFGEWYQVRWASQAQAAVTGWVPAQWVGTTTPIPVRIITPTPGS